MERSQPWRVAAAVVALLALNATVVAQDVLVRKGAHFEVHFHGSAIDSALANKIADQALAAAESGWPVASKLLKLRKVTAPAVHVYTDIEEFRKLEKQHTGGKLPLESFASLGEQEAHILLWPVLMPEALKVIGLSDTTRQTIIRRGAQLIAAQRCSLAIGDPWLGEVFAYGVLEKVTNPKHDNGVDPAYDTRRALLHHDLKHGNPREVRNTFLDFSAPTTRREYELQEEKKCLMAQVMAACNKSWAQKLLPAKKPKKKDKHKPAVVVRSAQVKKVLGKNWTKTESQFSKICNKVDPVWRVTGAMVAADKDGLVMAGNSDHTAALTGQEEAPDGNYAIHCTAKLHPSGEDSFRIQLDWDQKSMIGCFFGVGRVEIKRWSAEKNWELLAEGKAPINANVPFEASVESGDKVRLLVNGDSFLEWDRGSRDMHGIWSVAINDCVAWLGKLRIEPLAP